MVADMWKMELRVKIFKLDISTTPRQNSLHGPCHQPQGKDTLLISPS